MWAMDFAIGGMVMLLSVWNVPVSIVHIPIFTEKKLVKFQGLDEKADFCRGEFSIGFTTNGDGHFTSQSFTFFTPLITSSEKI